MLVVASKEIGLEVNAYKLITCSCFKTRMQNEFTEFRSIIVPLKRWNSSNIWEQHQ
jgi:hypothetical protein